MLNAMCDADFCGSWTQKYSNLRHSALSREGYVIYYSGCPVYWKSTMEREIALSTAEAEYIALSMCCRQLIPLRTILDEIAHNVRSPIPGLPICNPNSTCLTRLGKSQIMEDNSAALVIANDADNRYRPRTNHLCIKWHHFCDHVQPRITCSQKDRIQR